MLTPYIQQLLQKRDLSVEHCQTAIQAIINGVSAEQAAALLVLLHAKPETAEELYGIVKAMQAHMLSVSYHQPLLDIVGTGGDGSHSINISTATALLVASLGVKVAKHGNRAVSSRCGSADLLTALKIPIYLSQAQVQHALDTQQFAFLFAPIFHPAMQTIASVRHALGVRTTFNLIGPLLNPTQPTHYLIGVYETRLLEIYADVLQKLNVKRAIVVNGNGLDEISCIGPVNVIEVTPLEKKRYTIDPNDYGFSYCSKASLQGGNAEKNKQLILAAFNGEQSPILDTIILNAAVALHLVNHCPNIEAGVTLATEAIQRGTVLSFIDRLRAYSYA
jgi:anthranilate phosphoribosyltransferase